ncbi:MAG: 4-hydroxythreonine-4-phosphate dehydrogenase, partial [Gammaproteobacteria bacterium]
MNPELPRIALTLGEPAGIGPDIAVMMAQKGHPADITAIGDAHVLEARAKALGLPLTL